MAASYEDSAGFVHWYRQNPQAMQGIRTLVLENQVIDWLTERANIIDKQLSFDQIMNLQLSADEVA
jgi:trigger factor